MVKFDEVMEWIRTAYGSLEQPCFGFIQAAASDPRYRELRTMLAERFELQRDTDLNSDVSFGYVLHIGVERWVLRVSMVGPYAMLLRLHQPGDDLPVANSDPSSSEAERQLIDAVERSGFRLLDRDLLSQPVPLTLFNTAADRTRIYQALFVDTDFLPWEQ
jgi:hypothetical protein